MPISANRACAALNVTGIHPARHALSVPVRSSVTVDFDKPVLTSTINDFSFQVIGRWSGPMRGTFSFSNGNKSVTLTPNRVFQAGDLVTVILCRDIRAADNTPIRSAGYDYQFWTRTRPASMSFSTSAAMSNRGVTPQTRIYGANAADLNADGFPDLATVNEVSADVRVFLNNGTGNGSYGAFLTPFPISFEASPNESGDFNRDGKVDLAIAATGDSNVWILRGNGNGTFIPPGQQVGVGMEPHGIAVLDMNGDGAPDIATSNTTDDNVSLLLNDGAGLFSLASSFDAGGSGEYALGAADMNNDGIMDLVVGAINSQEIIILGGNGNGTFTEIGRQDAGGHVWMLTCGDVNGDGNMDVSTANSSSDNGSILLGNGAGGLSPASTVVVATHVVATDLGDLDGDGDLDWLLSSFGGSVWKIYKNDGAGNFTFDQQFSATSNPSCAVLLDFDGDRDIDLALTDEIADTITLKKNAGTRPLGDYNGDAIVDSTDYAQFAACYTGSGVMSSLACGHGDFDGDGDIDCADWTSFKAAWNGGGSPPHFNICDGVPIPAMGTVGGVALSLLMIVIGTIVLRRPSTAPLVRP
ncbi:MAG: VCBS repeat-containing protein [Planctomycetes bacterium]|nr:VCBS repeat-containing protein [Planctomycetota bacterium]